MITINIRASTRKIKAKKEMLGNLDDKLASCVKSAARGEEVIHNDNRLPSLDRILLLSEDRIINKFIIMEGVD